MKSIEIGCDMKGLNGTLVTMKPKVTAMMTVVAMEMAARSRSLRWPAKDWVTTVTENMARRLKMDGAATCHSFFDSDHVRSIRPPCS